jgi:hypothetical protein
MQEARMTRPKFETRTITLVGELQLRTAMNLLPNLPLDADKPLEMVIREKAKVRKPDQNALMWSGPLKDIESQAWVNGRQFSDVVWHEHFKKLYLPEEFDAELCKEGYRKWDYTPAGDKVLVGSTTQLTVRGFALYLEQVYADGAGMGVEFHVRDDRRRA